MSEITRIFDNCVPPVGAGQTLTITVAQQLLVGPEAMLAVTPSAPIQIETHGVQVRLTPGDIAGVYPADGSTDSPDEFLPHIALTRRTLPWERSGPQGQAWLALLLLRQSELAGAGAPGATFEATTVGALAARDPAAYARLRNDAKLPDPTEIDVAFIPHRMLQAILPTPPEVARLSHMKRIETPAITDTAIVISNRLPTAAVPAEPHTALLVSLEQRHDLYDGSRHQADTLDGAAALLVLHRWQFTPSTGGDFEQVMQSIGIKPNGGVLRFGNVPTAPPAGAVVPLSGGFDARLDGDGYCREPLLRLQGSAVEYRGPLRPFTPPPRSRGIAARAMPEEFAAEPAGSPLDYSHAAAFELGRLLALANTELVEDLHEVRRTYPEIKIVEANTLPPVLQKPDWVINPEPFWQMNPADALVRPEAELVAIGGIADVTGIQNSAPLWESAVAAQFGAAAAPVTPGVTPIDIGSIDAIGLDALMPVMVNLKV